MWAAIESLPMGHGACHGRVVRDYTRLEVWKRSHALALDVHEMSYELPARENFELGRQVRRAAFSIPTNIAEGAAQASRGHYAHYLTIGAGSASEVDYLLLACADLGYLDESDTQRPRRDAIEIRRMLLALAESVLAG